MKIWQAQELISKVETELDMSDEMFIPTAQEKYDYINEGILELERMTHTLHLDYFKKHVFLNVVQGVQTYAFPSDCYGHYIRKFFFLENGALTPATGGSNYEIVKVTLMQIPLIEVSEDYMYDVENHDPTVGGQIVIYPPPRGSTTTQFCLFYIRQANRVAGLTDLVDIPEGELFMFHYLRLKYLQKDQGNPLYEAQSARVDQEAARFKATMSSMAPANADGRIEADYSFYEEMY